jgi:hypothetical protein
MEDLAARKDGREESEAAGCIAPSSGGGSVKELKEDSMNGAGQIF